MSREKNRKPFVTISYLYPNMPIIGELEPAYPPFLPLLHNIDSWALTITKQIEGGLRSGNICN